MDILSLCCEHVEDMVALSGDQGVVCGVGPSGSDAPCAAWSTGSESSSMVLVKSFGVLWAGPCRFPAAKVHVALLNAGFLEVHATLKPILTYFDIF